MNKDSPPETVGIATFINSRHPPLELFCIAPGVPCDYALEQASTILGCVHKLIMAGVMDEDDCTVWAAYYLSGFAKAIIDVVQMGMKRG
ncbi:DUF3077 domain-containing protein [Pseudomonas sp. NUPR-001]|uniref:DUF3077 domain-containing protein n=1 Tax=Pseudomonas sp. NUPR-001 TaxID=3416058 RepID=UPI003F963C2D